MLVPQSSPDHHPCAPASIPLTSSLVVEVVLRMILCMNIPISNLIHLHRLRSQLGLLQVPSWS